MCSPVRTVRERIDDPIAMYKNDLCTIPSNLAGNAAASFPCGLADEDNLPVGFHVMAPVMRDDLCYQVGAALESALADQWGGVLMTKAPELEVTR